MIEPLGYKPKLLNAFMAILVLYLANYAFYRLGEVSRCGVLKKYEKIPFTKLLGTVLVERSVDLLIMILLLLLMFFTQFNVLQSFINNNELNGFI